MSAFDSGLIDSYVAPLREHLLDLDDRVSKLEGKLAELKAVRNRVAAAVRALDPPPPTEKKKPKGGKGMVVAESTLAEMTDWLQRFHDDPLYLDGVWALKLYEDPRFEALQSDSGIRNAINALHDRGVLALDRVGQGGRRIYKVVTE